MLGRSALILDKIFNTHICMRYCRGKLDDDTEKGILHEDCLPDFASLLHLRGMGIWIDNGWIPIETYGVSLPLKDPGKCPCVRRMVVVHQEVGDKDHCLNRAHRGSPEI